jgi:biopolymer transport protein ExbD
VSNTLELVYDEDDEQLRVTVRAGGETDLHKDVPVESLEAAIENATAHPGQPFAIE